MTMKIFLLLLLTSFSSANAGVFFDDVVKWTGKSKSTGWFSSTIDCEYTNSRFPFDPKAESTWIRIEGDECPEKVQVDGSSIFGIGPDPLR